MPEDQGDVEHAAREAAQDAAGDRPPDEAPPAVASGDDEREHTRDEREQQVELDEHDGRARRDAAR